MNKETTATSVSPIIYPLLTDVESPGALESVKMLINVAVDFAHSHSEDAEDGVIYTEQYLYDSFTGAVGFRTTNTSGDHPLSYWTIYLQTGERAFIFESFLSGKEDLIALLHTVYSVHLATDTSAYFSVLESNFLASLTDDLLPQQVAAEASAFFASACYASACCLDELEVEQLDVMVTEPWEKQLLLYLKSVLSAHVSLEALDAVATFRGYEPHLRVIRALYESICSALCGYVDRVVTSTQGANMAENRTTLLNSVMSSFIQDFNRTLDVSVLSCTILTDIITYLPDDSVALATVVNLNSIADSDVEAVVSAAIADRVVRPATRREKRAAARASAKSGSRTKKKTS